MRSKNRPLNVALSVALLFSSLPMHAGAVTAGWLTYGPASAGGGVTAIPTLGGLGLLLLALGAAALAWHALRAPARRSRVLSMLLAGVLLGGFAAGGGGQVARAANLLWTLALADAGGGTEALAEGVNEAVNRTGVPLQIQALRPATEQHALADPSGLGQAGASLCRVGLTLAPGARCRIVLVNTAELRDADEFDDEAFPALQERIEAGDVLDAPARQRLGAKAQDASTAYDQGLVCLAADLLGDLLQEAQGLRSAPTQAVVDAIYNRAHTLRDAITAAAGAASRCFDAAVDRRPQVALAASDDEHVAGTIVFGAPRIWTVTATDGETYTQVEIPGLETMIGEPGQPAIPSVQRLIAYPDGAELVLSFESDAAPPFLTHLYPFQESPVDQAQEPAPDPERFADRPFTKSHAAYAGATFAPEVACAITSVGRQRDLNLAQLSCRAGQYNPATQELRLFKAIHFDVRFRGGDGVFISSQATSPFEARMTDSLVSVPLNNELLRRKVATAAFDWRVQGPNTPIAEWLQRSCYGEELLIFTHSDFLSAADRLADWKREKGIVTTVFTVRDGIGQTMDNTHFPLDTAASISRFINHRYDKCVVRPSYVLLLGDAEFVPPFQSNLAEDHHTGTDHPYAVRRGYEFDPNSRDFGYGRVYYSVGRIPVDTLAQADTVVDKVIGYEKSPPVVEPRGMFYDNISIASQFECCRFEPSGDNQGAALNGQSGTDQRAFIETSELVRNALLAAGNRVERIYTETVDSNYTGDTKPRRYFNGKGLPIALGKGGRGISWGGGTADIRAAWNEGRFLMIHRDHGYPLGWAHPSFTSGDVRGLTNGNLLPVVYSINCASGLFDNETMPLGAAWTNANGNATTLGSYYGVGASTVSFAEAALRLTGGGAVGLIGDTRNSPTWANNALLRGLIDATWPDTVPEFGRHDSRRRRLGDILRWGKLYLLMQMDVTQTAGSVTRDQVHYEYLIWHVIGDPTLEMWTSDPNPLRIVPSYSIDALQRPNIDLSLVYAGEGASITVQQQQDDGSTLPLGRTEVRGGLAQFKFVQKPQEQRPLLVSACAPDGVCVRLQED